MIQQRYQGTKRNMSQPQCMTSLCRIRVTIVLTSVITRLITTYIASYRRAQLVETSTSVFTRCMIHLIALQRSLILLSRRQEKGTCSWDCDATGPSPRRDSVRTPTLGLTWSVVRRRGNGNDSRLLTAHTHSRVYTCINIHTNLVSFSQSAPHLCTFRFFSLSRFDIMYTCVS